MVTARSESKAKDFAQSRSRFKDLLEVTITGDLGTVGAFDDLAKDVDVIIHCASVSPILVLVHCGANRFGIVERDSTFPRSGATAHTWVDSSQLCGKCG